MFLESTHDANVILFADMIMESIKISRRIMNRMSNIFVHILLYKAEYKTQLNITLILDCIFSFLQNQTKTITTIQPQPEW